jgi:tRNA(Ser,Leu) C12 N-acetylase TAN1
MRDWNVVATIRGQGFDRARQLLGELGVVHSVGMYNVVVMKVSDVWGFLGALQRRFEQHPEVAQFLGRVIPVTRTFEFETPEEFEAMARQAALAFVPNLAGKSFHVRFHRRGFKGRLLSPDEERFLDGALLESLRAAGTPGRITFDDPDAVLSVETVGHRAGLSLWTRDELQRYPFLRPD